MPTMRASGAIPWKLLFAFLLIFIMLYKLTYNMAYHIHYSGRSVCSRIRTQPDHWEPPDVPDSLTNLSQTDPQLIRHICENWILPPFTEHLQVVNNENIKAKDKYWLLVLTHESCHVLLSYLSHVLLSYLGNIYM